jgi:hypothetical protein
MFVVDIFGAPCSQYSRWNNLIILYNETVKLNITVIPLFFIDLLWLKAELMMDVAIYSETSGSSSSI